MDTELGKIILGGIVAQFGAVLAFFISLKVAIAKQEVIVERLVSDVNNLGQMVRANKEQAR